MFGALVAMAGSAVGLGNLWRFPYLVGTNGGAAFIIIYLLFVFILCVPIMVAEFVIGRRSQSNVFGAFKILAPGSKWGITGIIAMVASISILSFYSVVGGWTIDYLVRAISFHLYPAAGESYETAFHSMVSAPVQPLIFTLIFLLVTGAIVLGGVKKGIEKYTKIMMPLLFVMVIIIAIRSISLPNSSAGISFLFKPDFSQVNSDTFLNALGQAFFSLSLGCGTILTYGSYVQKNESILKISSLTALSDTMFAIIAGLAIMPAVFSFGISPSEGPGLVFIILPQIFHQITGGDIVAILFFLILLIAAVTSSISLLEVAVAYIKEEFNISRKGAVAISLGVSTLFGVLCSLSQGVLKDVKIFGNNFFDFFNNLSSNILMPIGCLLIVLFVGWKMKKNNFVEEMSNNGALKNKAIYKTIFFIIRYIAPFVILLIMLMGLLF